MKLKNILTKLKEDVDPDAMATANSLLLIDKLSSNADLMKGLSELQLPSDKYKAIVKFANLLGIPEERFADFITNTQVQIKNNNI